MLAIQATGVAWLQNRIAEIERGQKAIGVEDLVVLSAGLTNATGKPVTAGDLIEAEASIQVTKSHSMRGADIVSTLGGGLAVEVDDTLLIQAAGGTRSEAHVADRQAQALARAFGLTDGTHGALIEDVRRGGFTEADQRAARGLGLTTSAFAYVAHHLWKQSMTNERERRVRELVSSPASSGVRAHMTRQLLKEARTVLAEVADLPDPQELDDAVHSAHATHRAVRW